MDCSSEPMLPTGFRFRRFAAEAELPPKLSRAFRTGHVTIGGSICIELLTNASWNPLYRLEGVMTHVLSTIYGEPGDPPARLDERNRSDYSTGEAMDAFPRLLATHGWSHWLKSI